MAHGVVIVKVNRYVKIWNVNGVLSIHSLPMTVLNYSTYKKTTQPRDKYINILIKHIGSNVQKVMNMN